MVARRWFAGQVITGLVLCCILSVTTVSAGRINANSNDEQNTPEEGSQLTYESKSMLEGRMFIVEHIEPFIDDGAARMSQIRSKRRAVLIAAARKYTEDERRRKVAKKLVPAARLAAARRRVGVGDIRRGHMKWRKWDEQRRKQKWESDWYTENDENTDGGGRHSEEGTGPDEARGDTDEGGGTPTDARLGPPGRSDPGPEDEQRREMLMRQRQEEVVRLQRGRGPAGTGEDVHRRRPRFGPSVTASARPTQIASTPIPGSPRRTSHRDPSARSSCTDCEIADQTYPGHSRFQYESNCLRYQCVCRCDGTYECPERYTTKICEPEPRPVEEGHTHQCRNCNAKGQVIQSQEYFDFQDGCTLFKRCQCYCNGSWECSANNSMNTCGNSPVPDLGRHSHSNAGHPGECQNCLVQGNKYPGNTKFQYIQKCTATDCVCMCNGTVKCDGKSTTDTCSTSSPTMRSQPKIIMSRNRHYVENEEDCKQCLVEGTSIDGHSKFNLKYKCYLDVCYCHCNGRYSCIRRLSSNMCDYDSGVARGTHIEGHCQDCFLQGKTYQGNSTFQYDSGCTARDCTCTCDGVVQCRDNHSRSTCSTDGVTVKPLHEVFTENPDSANCVECNVNGTAFDGNSYFDLKRGCFIELCHCRCNGEYTCTRHRDKAHYICNGTSIPEPNTTVSSACRSCTLEGKQYNGNTVFKHRNGCTVKNCKCSCAGFAECDETSAVNVCTTSQQHNPSTSISNVQLGSDGCSACTVDGKDFAGGSEFKLKRGCTQYPCQCDCNGRWGCNTGNAENICDTDGNLLSEHREDNSDTSDGSQTGNEGMSSRNDETHQDNAETSDRNEQDNASLSNTHRQDTNVMSHGVSQANGGGHVTPVPVIMTTDCRKCVVGEQEYEGNSAFVYSHGCLGRRCTCTCLGAVECNLEVINICTTVAPADSVCTSCQINGTTVAGNTDFEHKQGCSIDKCRCECDGRYTCTKHYDDLCNETIKPDHDADLNEGNKGCRQCYQNGQWYEGNSTFRHTIGCTAIQCTCMCNGSVICDAHAKTAVNICTTESTTGRPQEEASTSPSVPQGTSTVVREDLARSCKSCLVDGISYDGNTKFKLKRGCLIYPCQCNCGGKWGCNSASALNICNESEDSEYATCKRCVVKGKKYPGGSKFRLREGCLSFKCKCFCDGSYTCPPDMSANHCPGSTAHPAN